MSDTLRIQMETELIQLFKLLEVEWQFHDSQSHWGFYLPESETCIWGRHRNDPFPEELSAFKNVVLFQEIGSVKCLAYLLDKAVHTHLPSQASRYMAVPPDPIELGMAQILDKLHIDYQGSGLRKDLENLDFYIPEIEAYIEVKQMHPTRPMAKSLRQLQGQENVLLLQGMGALACLNYLIDIAAKKGSIFSTPTIRDAPNRENGGQPLLSDPMPFKQS